MASHEIKNCSRCGALFECKAGSITQCQCFTVSLTETERHYIARHFTDCLCAACLQQVKLICAAPSSGQPEQELP